MNAKLPGDPGAPTLEERVAALEERQAKLLAALQRLSRIVREVGETQRAQLDLLTEVVEMVDERPGE